VRLRAVPLLLALAGCAVGDPNYPAKWEPLVPSPIAHCRGFEGTYADRGETRDRLSARSLTRELFGYDEQWKTATRVELTMPGDDLLRVTVLGTEGTLFRRDLHAGTDFECDAGKLVVRDKRWVAEDLVAGREKVTLELHNTRRHLVVQIKETTYAVVFLVVPLVADATHWYRFERVRSRSD
jgi:hypothetical protein